MAEASDNDEEALAVQDMRERHYMPAKQAPWCNVWHRVSRRIENGKEPNKYALVKVPTTTDLAKVTCPRCRRAVRYYVRTEWPE